MSAANEKFIRLYEELVTEVNRRAKRPTSHSFEIEAAAASDGAVKKNDRVLRYIRDVRHALQHPRHSSTGHAIVISDTFLGEIERLLRHLQNPPTAGKVGVALKQIRTASPEDRIGDLADDMKRNGYTHLPILNEKNAVIGVFNEASVFDYLWSESETIIARATQVSEILHHCRLDADHTEAFRFVSPRVTLDDLADLFSALQSPTTRIGAVFVTASGKANESLQRLITPWDVFTPSSE